MILSPTVTDLDYQSLVNWDDPLTQGLVFWHLNLPGRFGGVRAYDLVNGRLFTRTGMASPSTATSGPGTTTRPGGWGEERCDGSNDYLQVATSQILFNQPNFTISAWAMPSDNAGTYEIYCEDIADGPVLLFRVVSGLLQFGIYNGAAFPLANGVTTLPVGAWSHVAATKQGTAMTVWLNGRLEGTGTFSGYTGTAVTSVQIGRTSAAGGAEYWKGMLDDVLLATRALDTIAIYTDSRTFHPRMLRRVGVPMGMSAAVAGTALPESWMQYRSRRGA